MQNTFLRFHDVLSFSECWYVTATTGFQRQALPKPPTEQPLFPRQSVYWQAVAFVQIRYAHPRGIPPTGYASFSHTRQIIDGEPNVNPVFLATSAFWFSKASGAAWRVLTSKMRSVCAARKPCTYFCSAPVSKGFCARLLSACAWALAGSSVLSIRTEETFPKLLMFLRKCAGRGTSK